jgi:uncharacterized protein (TIRG00374 family)
MLVPAIAGAYLFIIVRALRWKLMAEQQKKITVMQALSLYGAGQIVNIAMPILTGQVGRMFLFSKKGGFRKSFIFSTIVLEILFDAIALIVFLVLISLAFAFPDKYRSLGVVIASATIVLLVLLYLILHYKDSLNKYSRSRFREKWPGTYVTIKKFLGSFTKGINMLKSSQHMLGSITLSLIAWILHTLSIYFLFKSFGFDLPVAAAATVMIVNTIALMIPITPGNAGTFEVAVSRSLTAFAVGRSDAVLFALALHIIDILPIFTFGLYFMRAEHVSIKEIKKQQRESNFKPSLSAEAELVEDNPKKEIV